MGGRSYTIYSFVLNTSIWKNGVHSDISNQEFIIKTLPSDTIQVELQGSCTEILKWHFYWTNNIYVIITMTYKNEIELFSTKHIFGPYWLWPWVYLVSVSAYAWKRGDDHESHVTRMTAHNAIGSVNGLVSNRRQAITWNNDEPIHWRLYINMWYQWSFLLTRLNFNPNMDK